MCSLREARVLSIQLFDEIPPRGEDFLQALLPSFDYNSRMPRKEVEKGRALEDAVRFIQETILKYDPRLKGAGFSIETNRILTVAGVRHEVDDLVKSLHTSM